MRWARRPRIASPRAAGGIRLRFGDELNIRIMQRSLPAFERFDAAIGFHQSGDLFLLDDAADMARFEQAVALSADRCPRAGSAPPHALIVGL